MVGIAGDGRSEPAELGVAVEEEWDVDEYDVSLLSARESSGLLTFLRERGLALPERADEVLRAYIETGHRFAFLQTDPSRAHVVGGRMVLSPIQLQYESDELRVPVRLGTLNSPGEQELLLYVLSREGRYEVANRESLVAPTGIRLRGDYDGGFAPFYAGLMDQLFANHEGAAVTEYATRIGGWGGVSARLVWYLGLDRYRTDPNQYSAIHWRDVQRWTLTRIRHRYGTELDDDLVLRPAEALRDERPRTFVRTGTGASAFDVRFTVEHEAEVCPSWRQRNALALDWAATSDRLWGQDDTVWPGVALLDPVLGIEPGSEPPPEPEPVLAIANAPNPETPTAEPAVVPASNRHTAGCAAGRSNSGGAQLIFLVPLAALLFRRGVRGRSS